MTGRVELTPIQRWFFEQGFAEPQHFNQARIVAYPASITRSDIETALADLVQHHDMLRTCFEL